MTHHPRSSFEQMLAFFSYRGTSPRATEDVPAERAQAERNGTKRDLRPNLRTTASPRTPPLSSNWRRVHHPLSQASASGRSDRAGQAESKSMSSIGGPAMDATSNSTTKAAAQARSRRRQQVGNSDFTVAAPGTPLALLLVNKRDGMEAASEGKKRGKQPCSGSTQEGMDKRPKKNKKKVIVVSPYFSSPSLERTDVDVIVQAKRKKKRISRTVGSSSKSEISITAPSIESMAAYSTLASRATEHERSPQQKNDSIETMVDPFPSLASPPRKESSFFSWHGNPNDKRGKIERIIQTESTWEEGVDDFSLNGESENNPMDATKNKRFSSGSMHEEPNRKSGKRKKKKEAVVVSRYFAPAFSTVAGGDDDKKVVVDKKRKKLKVDRTVEHSADLGAPSGCRQDLSKGLNVTKRKLTSTQLSAAERMADAYKRVPDDCPWIPPFSEHDLLQEYHFFDHWRVLVICMLLNRTTGREVRRVLPRLFLLCPDAETTTRVPEEEIEQIIRPLGLQRKRSKMIKRMSEEYLQPEWTHVTQLHGIGKYAADAYAIFCSGMWKEVKPVDHKLVVYWSSLLNDKDTKSIMVEDTI